MSDFCEHETFKDVCPICHRDAVIDKLRAAGLHQTSEKILEQAARIRILERALRIIAEHPVEQSGKFEVGAMEMIKVARIALGEPEHE